MINIQKYLNIDGNVKKELGLHDDIIIETVDRLREPHRFYHNEEHHVSRLFDFISTSFGGLDSYTEGILKVIALFHDAIYLPGCKNNEIESADLFKQSVKDVPLADEIYLSIAETDYLTYPEATKKGYAELFRYYDLYDLTHGDPIVWRENTVRLFREFQKVPFSSYRFHTKEFLYQLAGLYPKTAAACDFQIKFVDSWRPKIGIYAGSFNPFHSGHMDILEQAEGLFDKVIIGIGKNSQKSNVNRYEPSDSLPFHEVFTYYDMLSTMMRQANKDMDVVLVRGLRNGHDLQYEERLLRYVQDDFPEVKVVYLCCKPHLSHVSSSGVRDIMFYDRVKGREYLPSKYHYYKTKFYNTMMPKDKMHVER